MKKIIAYLMGAGASLIVTFRIPEGTCSSLTKEGQCSSLSEVYFTLSAVTFFCVALYLFVKEEFDKEEKKCKRNKYDY